MGENAELVTRDTIFFPTGGGQSCDRGTISFDGNTVEILNVYEKDDEVMCFCLVTGYMKRCGMHILR